MNYKQNLCILMKWMLPHIPYMARIVVVRNIRNCVYFTFEKRPLNTSAKKMLKYLYHISKKADDKEFLQYCYNLLLFAEGLGENVR